MEHSREECLVFKNTHPTLITREVWDVVQRVRKNTRPRPWRSDYNGIGYVGSGQQDVEEALEAPESLQTQDTAEAPAGIVNTMTCRGIQGITCYPCEGGTKASLPLLPPSREGIPSADGKIFQRMPHSCEYHCAASGTATPPRRYSAASAHFARYDRASSNQTSCSVPPRQKL